ncbi:hypothetical protein [Candidatus Absconditicoccus praedator]|uniref:hypothetical protein n=1 Tax=Candidatus Absconditicoccus praedator TaxID=2735562 RepID=UPI001E43D72D|nr:hypothetical protein [Candidatus Absconditicoccus praedator]UFX82892.1 hypothetical protein HLG78_02040 [Candidatus Absconditicoccus praedator]
MATNNKDMKDFWQRIFRIIVGLAFLGYIGFLIINSVSLVGEEALSTMQDYIMYGVLILLFLVFVYDGVKPICFNKPRLAYFFVSMFMIMFGYYGIQDAPDKYLYIGDMVSFLGVLIFILGMAGFLTPKLCQEKIEEEKVEIIEA